MTCEGTCSHGCAVINGDEQCYCPTGLELLMPGGTDCVGMYDIDDIRAVIHYIVVRH